MPREISDEEWNFLQQEHQVASMARSVWEDPKLGPHAKALLKEKMPNMPIPDHDIRAEMDRRFEEFYKRDDEEREQHRVQTEDAFWKGERKKVQDQYGYTEDGMKDLEKMMLEKHIGDYEVAATYHTAKNPKPSEPTSGYKDPYWNHTKSDLFQQIAKDPEEWGRSEIIKAITNDQNRNKVF